MFGRNWSSATFLLTECGHPWTSAQRAKHENWQCFAGGFSSLLLSCACSAVSGSRSEIGKECVPAELCTTESSEVFGNYSFGILHDKCVYAIEVSGVNPCTNPCPYPDTVTVCLLSCWYSCAISTFCLMSGLQSGSGELGSLWICNEGWLPLEPKSNWSKSSGRIC